MLCQPPIVEIYYVPPSGKSRGGPLRDYKLLNVDRALFDQWLLERAEEAGAELAFKASFTGLSRDGSVSIKGFKGKVKARFLVGADGVYSTVRKQLYGLSKRGLALILQEYYEGESCFENYFYTVLQRYITPMYSYVIPKGRFHVVGTGVPEGYSLLEAASRFKDWLKSELGFKGVSMAKREAWAIPYGFTAKGTGSTVLVGDAAGFCNAFSGEGIRSALESGLMAAEAIAESMSSGKSLARLYSTRVRWVESFVKSTRELAASFAAQNYEEVARRHEELVKRELARAYRSWGLKL